MSNNTPKDELKLKIIELILKGKLKLIKKSKEYENNNQS